jgi:hypothetical protein
MTNVIRPGVAASLRPSGEAQTESETTTTKSMTLRGSV